MPHHLTNKLRARQFGPPQSQSLRGARFFEYYGGDNANGQCWHLFQPGPQTIPLLPLCYRALPSVPEPVLQLPSSLSLTPHIDHGSCMLTQSTSRPPINPLHPQGIVQKRAELHQEIYWQTPRQRVLCGYGGCTPGICPALGKHFDPSHVVSVGCNEPQYASAPSFLPC